MNNEIKGITSLLLLVLCSLSWAEIKFLEEFNDDSWTDRWVQSKHRSDYGEFKLSAGKYFQDEKRDQGIKTSQDARFYAISAMFPEKFTNRGKPLVVQLTVKHEQNIDCGGGYVKVMASDIDQRDFHGETPYSLMFGPDICGPSNKKVHVIFHYKGKNHLIKKDIRCKDDELSHLYTLILNPDNTYEVQIDGEKAESGSLESDWDFLPPKKIKDPDAKKPEDWVDNGYMDDPEDKKPEDWDKPEHIPDPEAKKPDDWDDDMDGEWEPPMIDNPEHKGEWKPKQIKNPDFKGRWIHPEIDNPDYQPDDDLYLHNDLGAIGLDIWQVKAGTIFDNILVADDVKDAKEHAARTFELLRESEKSQKEAHDEEERKRMEEEEKKLNEEAKAKKKSGGGGGGGDDDDDEEVDEDEDEGEVEEGAEDGGKEASKEKEKRPKKSAEKRKKGVEEVEDHDEL